METPTTHLPLSPLAVAVRASRRRRCIAAGLAVGLVGALLLGSCALMADGDEQAAGPGGLTAPAVAGKATTGNAAGPADAPPRDAKPINGADTDAAPDPDDDTAEDAADASDDSAGYPDGGGTPQAPPDPEGDGGEPVELDPVADDDDPCGQVKAEGGGLLVGPDPAVLEPGVLSSTLWILNCDDEPVDWTAATKPTVALAHAGGNLSPGSMSELGYTIDADAYEPGAISFKIKVSEPGRNHYVDVSAFRPTFGKDLVPDLGLSGGADAGGCANQCITTALLSANLTSPDLGLDVGTNTAATISVYVSKNAPVADPKGNPVFPGKAPLATSPAGTTDWSTTLTPLQPATKYYLIVKATDANAKASYRSTSFTTITPVENPGGLVNPAGGPGCAVQCITKAVLAPGASATEQALAVTSHTPARFMVWVGTQAPQYADGAPHFGDLPALAESDDFVESWDTKLGGLTADHDYHIIVRATDADGNRAYRVGQFHTAKQDLPWLMVGFEKIHVTHDGDASAGNRGELSFAWGTADFTLGTRGEEKMNGGTTLAPDGIHSEFLVPNAEGFLPTLYVSGSERDADGLAEFCTMGTGVFLDPGHSDSCDAKWNVASSGLVSVDSLAGLPRCAEFGIAELADHACMLFETPSNGDDYARFEVVVSIRIIA